jgi:hypothetical protein
MSKLFTVILAGSSHNHLFCFLEQRVYLKRKILKRKIRITIEIVGKMDRKLKKICLNKFPLTSHLLWTYLSMA